MDFLAPASVPPQPDKGNFHVPGGTYSTDAPPALIVQFTTATPDLPVWTLDAVSAAAPTDPSPPSISGHAGSLPEEPRPVIVGAFNTI
jgi:hypothetical protein